MVWASFSKFMHRLNKNSLHLNISPLRLHSAASVHIPNTTYNQLFNSKPFVRLSQLKLHSATSFVTPSINVFNCFQNPKVTLSPLKNSIIRKYSKIPSLALCKKPRVYPTISKCNSKRCKCCNYLCSGSTIKSTVNGRVFSVDLPYDID